MRKQLLRLIIGILLVGGIPGFSEAQTAMPPVHAPAADSLRQDFNFLRTLLNTYYPSLYRYNSKSSMQAMLDSCYAAIHENTTAAGFYKMLKALVSSIKDGHLYVGPPPAVRKYFGDTAVFFPVKLRFINNKVYSMQAMAGRPAGAEILAINHRPVARIREALFKYIAGDGDITTKKNYVLNSFFHIYYNMVYGNTAAFSMAVKTAGNAVDTVTLHAVPLKRIPGMRDTPGKLLQCAFRKNNIAVLTISSFDSATLRNAGFDYRRFLDSAFTTIHRRNAAALIIDLRGNGGGTDLYGSLLYAYLTSRPFHYYKSLTAATRQLPYEQFGRTVSSYNDLGPGMLDSIAPHSYRLQPQAHTNLQLLQPAGHHYNGRVLILADGLSYSVTAEFCAVAKSYRRAIFIGEETGGGYEGNTSAVQIDTVLPASKIPVSFGTIAYTMDVRKPARTGRGTIPEYIVSPTIDNIIHKRDVQLEFALKLAAGVPERKSRPRP